MFLRVALIPALALAVSIAHAGASKQAEVVVGTKQPGERLLAPMHVDVKIAADGKVTAVRPDSSLPAAISERLAAAVGQWRFSPAKRQGAPIDWATRVKVTLTAVPIEQGYVLRVSKASAASVWHLPEGMKPPKFPFREMVNGKNAELAVIIEPGIGGSPTVVRSIYVDGKLASNRDSFAKAIREVAPNWAFEALQWDGVTYLEPVCTPVAFLVNKDPPQETESACQSVPEIQNEEFLPIRLETKPEGSIL